MQPMQRPDIKAILFDLDGTLADTAPDMSRAINRLRIEEGFEPLPAEDIRPQVSNGSLGLVKLAFGITPDTDVKNFEQLRDRFLDLYAGDICQGTGLFDGMAEVLEHLEALNMPWGIVTNKPEFLTTPLVEKMGLTQRSGSTISGDSIPQRKPHPAPLLLACREIATDPQRCLYLGDAERDIQAARAARMPNAVAGWGYIDTNDAPEQWGADELLGSVAEILNWLPAH